MTYAGNPHSLVDLAEHPRYEFLQADIADAARMHEVFSQVRPDSVFHLAAESHVDRSLNDHAQSAFRFVNVSTDEVYGSLGDTGLFSESSSYDPHSPYAATKAAADHLARVWNTTYGLPVIVTNCSNNYGPYQFPEKLLPLMIIKCLSDEPLPVYRQGTNVRDWLYVTDHVNALAIILSKGKPGETYNIGGNSEQRNIDLVHLVCEIMDELRPKASGATHAERITHVRDRPGHDFRYATKIRRELQWQPRHRP